METLPIAITLQNKPQKQQPFITNFYSQVYYPNLFQSQDYPSASETNYNKLWL